MSIVIKFLLSISIFFMSSVAVAHTGHHAHLGNLHFTDVVAILTVFVLAFTIYCYRK